MRKCNTCKNTLSITDFGDTSKKIHKKCIKCREKCKEYYEKHKKEILQKVKKYYEQNKIKIIEQHKEYRKQNEEEIKRKGRTYYEQHKEETKEKRKEYFKRYRRENKEKIAEKNKRYYRNNKEYIKIKDKEYYQNNKERVRECHKIHYKSYYKNNRKRLCEKGRAYNKTPQGIINSINNRIKYRGYIGEQSITKDEWVQVMKLNIWRCFYCDEVLLKNNRTLDHLVPLSKGGKHVVGNLLPCCRYCNSSKGNREVLNWHKYSNLSYEKQIIINTMLEEMYYLEDMK